LRILTAAGAKGFSLGKSIDAESILAILSVKAQVVFFALLRYHAPLPLLELPKLLSQHPL
jgi:hypothetical protein